MNKLLARSPSAVKSTVELRRQWLGFEGPPKQFVIGIVPPKP